MASLSIAKDGRKMIQFIDRTGQRKTVSLGKGVTKKDAERIKFNLEDINAALSAGEEVSDDSRRWLESRDAKLRAKLAKVGLVADTADTAQEDAPPQHELAGFIDSYVAKRKKDLKPGTVYNLERARIELVGFLKADALLAHITKADAIDFSRHLRASKNSGGRGMGENSARRVCGRCRQFFKAAIDGGLIAKNPFVDKRIPTRVGGKDKEFVSREIIAQVIDACPDEQWKLIVSLARFGGLRRQEPLLLTWGDVHWDRDQPTPDDRLTVHAPKTEHHDGKGTRIIPIFPELRPHLEAVYDELLEGFDPKAQRLSEQPIIRRYRPVAGQEKNLGTQLKRIIVRAGLDPWPAPFNALRSSRETELANDYPLHVACYWIGNSEDVAKKHYLQVTDQHFAAALGQESAAQSAAVAPASPCQPNPKPTKPRVGTGGRRVNSRLATPQGLEQTDDSPSITMDHLIALHEALQSDSAEAKQISGLLGGLLSRQKRPGEKPASQRRARA